MLPFSLKTAIWLAVVAAFFACVADISLLFHPTAGYLDGEFLFMKDISQVRLLVGHYLGLIFIPFYIFGFYFLYKIYEPVAPQLGRCLFWGASLLMFPGIAYHTFCSAVALKVKHHFVQYGHFDNWDKNLEGARIFFEPMAAIFVLGFILFSGILFWSILKSKTRLPSSYAWYNPALIYLLCILTHLIYRPVGNFFLVAGFNFALFVFFLVIALHYNKLNLKEDQG